MFSHFYPGSLPEGNMFPWSIQCEGKLPRGELYPLEGKVAAAEMSGNLRGKLLAGKLP